MMQSLHSRGHGVTIERENSKDMNWMTQGMSVLQFALDPWEAGILSHLVCMCVCFEWMQEDY
jgi:hypothetical protein